MKAGQLPNSLYAKYFLDWTDAVTKIRSAAPGAVTHVGELLVVDLDRAAQQLGRPTSG